MRNRAICLAALLIGLIASGPGHAQDVVNLLTNGGFETGALSPWGNYANNGGVRTQTVVQDCVGADVPEGPIEGKYCLHVNVTTVGTNFYSIGLQPRPQHDYEQGKKYTFSVFLKCKTGTLQVNLKPELATGAYTGYGAQVVTITDKWVEYHVTTPVFTTTVTPAQVSMHIGYAVAEFWVDDAKLYEGDYIPTVVANKFGAQNPTPDTKAVDVPREVIASWKAGPFAATHNVFFGDNFDDVNDATVANPLGVQVSAGQTGTTFDPADTLEFGKTYYWRVDEVNAPSKPATFKGDVWSFTVEPYAYTLTGVTATASSFTPNMGPEKTVNGSGLNADGQHSTVDMDMWLSATGQPMPAWIQYNLGRVYKLQSMQVWNSNQKVEPFVGFGAKSTTIEYSLDGQTWSTLDTVEIPRAGGLEGYTGSTVDMAGLEAQYVKLTIAGSWGGFIPQAGLSEVRFTYIPVLAREPQPASGSEGASLEPALSWRPGRDAVSHKVYVSGDRQAVVAGTALVATVAGNSYQAGNLEYGRTYYWKVDEVNDAATPPVREGQVWSFSTVESFAVDDFESYNDDDKRIYDAWIDGYTTKASGSTVGNLQAPFAERSITHGGRQSMPMDYDNSAAPYYSEAEQAFSTTQNWTVKGVTDLIVWFRGNGASFLETASGITMSAAGADIWNTADEFRYAFKRLTGNGSVTVKVNSLTNTNVWAKAGVMIRESLDPGSTFAYMVATPGSGVSFGWRPTTNSTCGSATQTGVTIPQWVKLTRTGDAFTAQYSADGKTWTDIKDAGGKAVSTSITMTGNIYIGLCVTSHNPAAITTAQFSDAATTGNVTGAWQAAEVGVDHPGNDPDGLYVTVQDSGNRSATVAHPDPAASAAATWTEWRIPLSSLKSAGVNTAAIKKLVIGVGSKTSPKAGGKGRVYIDDVQVGRRGSSDPGLGVAYYALENDATDGSGNGHDGTAMGAPVYIDGPAGLGKALLFDGKGGQYVALGTWNPSAATGELSVSLWARWNGLTTFWQGLMGKRDTWAAGETMWQIEANQTTGGVSFARHNITGANAPALTVGEWTHIVLTFDRTTAQFYYNGKKVGTSTAGFSFGPDTEAGMAFGACEGAGGNPFNGALDEVYLFDRALSSFEVSFLAGIQ